MVNQPPINRKLWVAAGIVLGLCISWYWPHEPALAATTDRSSKFAIATVEISPLYGLDGIFILDFLTGRLIGHVLNNKTGKFTYKYTRNVAADFRVDPNAEPNYAIVSGAANLTAKGSVTPASGVIYIAELTSGKVICYSFPYKTSNRPLVAPITPIASFPFRQPSTR